MGEPVFGKLGSLARRKGLWTCLTFLLILLYGSIWVWQGLDVTDEGVNLAYQWVLINRSQYYVYDAKWLSHLVGGLWLKLIGDWGVIGARFGWALVLSLTGLSAHWTMRRYYNSLIACVSVTLTGMASMYRTYRVIDHHNFPAFLLVCASGLLLVSQEAGGPERRKRWFALLSGLLLGVGVVARFPYVVSLAIPFIPPLMHTLLERRWTAAPWLRVGITFLGVLLSITICLTCLHSAGGLSWYLVKIASPFVAVPGLGVGPERTNSLFDTYLKDGATAIAEGTAFSLAGFILAVGIAVLLNFRKRKWVSIGLFGILFWGLLVFFRGYFLVLPGICFALAVVDLVLAALARPRSAQLVDRLALLVVGSCIAGLSFVGSNNSVPYAKFGLWLLMPSAFLLLPELLEAVSLRLRRVKIAARDGVPFAVAAMCAVAFLGSLYQFRYPYRDVPNRFLLTAPVEHPRLRGVLTSPGRANSVGQMLSEVDRRVQAGDAILAYNCIPMVYYATQTVYPLGYPWITNIAPAQVSARLDQLESSGTYPRLVVRATTNTRDPEWGTRPVSPFSYSVLVENLNILDQWVQNHGYREVWSNADFVIYEPLASGETALDAGK